MRYVSFLTLVLLGCAGSHPSERPQVSDCPTAFATGQHGDPCQFEGECGTSEAGGATRRGAVCDGGSLLLARIEERFEDAVAPCPGSRDRTIDAFVSFTPTRNACVEVTFCHEIFGGGAALRIAELCQIGAASPAPRGDPFTGCGEAAQRGVDGDPCTGPFGCFEDRVIAPGDVLPIVVWCDSGTLRLAPSQTLILGAP